MRIQLTWPALLLAGLLAPLPAQGFVADRISAADMQRMNYEVDGRRRDPRSVANAFLDAMRLRQE